MLDWKTVNHGDWIFTCRMEPVQFDKWVYNDVHPDMGPDYFKTLEGSEHSRYHCSLKPISKEYAEWFIHNQIWTYFTFFMNSRVVPQSQWVRVSNKRYYRVAINGVQYHYFKPAGEGFRLIFIKYEDFVFFVYDHDFNLGSKKQQWLWRVYEAYIRHRAFKDGIPYEGY